MTHELHGDPEIRKYGDTRTVSDCPIRVHGSFCAFEGPAFCDQKSQQRSPNFANGAHLGCHGLEESAGGVGRIRAEKSPEFAEIDGTGNRKRKH
jgi:hypothetical protein